MLYVHTTQQLKCRCRRQNNSIVFGLLRYSFQGSLHLYLPFVYTYMDVRQNLRKLK